MSFEERGESVLASVELADLKLVYRVLHAHITEHPELMDTDFLIELQTFLHRKATAEGVDGANHSAWDEWLGNMDMPSCTSRVARRRELELDDTSSAGE